MFRDSIKFYLRFNWIYRGFDCKKNWFLSQFRLLLEEIKVLGSNYNFEELIWPNQGFNCIIIEVGWLIRDLIDITRNQGPNQKRHQNQGIRLQFCWGFDYKIAKTSMTKLEEPKQRRFHWSAFHCPQQLWILIKKEGDVNSDNGAIFKSRGARIAADISGHCDARRLTKNACVLWL